MNGVVGSTNRRPLPSVGDKNALGRRHKPDYLLMLYVLILLAIGLVVIYSVSPAISVQVSGDTNPNHFMYRQLLYLGLGLVVFTAVANVPLGWWSKLQKYIIWFAVFSFFLLLIPAFSLNYGGATRWVHIGSISYQPAELLKFGLLFYLAMFLARKYKEGTINSKALTINFLVLMGLIALEIVILQRDLGTMIPIAAIMLTMLYLSGIGKKQFTRILLIIAGFGMLTVLVAPHRMARVLTFLNPGDDVGGSGYHINQALIAVGSGGMFGKGLGRSVQAYGYLPEAANDSIFAIMAEKFGFIGLLAVFAVYGSLLMKIVSIAKKAPNMYLRLICGGVFAWMCTQAFVNIGAMLGVMPLTGVTLPLLSFGGTSLIFSLAGLGVVFHISRYTRLGNENSNQESTNSTSRRRVGRPRYALKGGR